VLAADSQLGEEARARTLKNYIRKGKMWQAFESGGQDGAFDSTRSDKADIEIPQRTFANELDKMEFFSSMRPAKRSGGEPPHRESSPSNNEKKT